MLVPQHTIDNARISLLVPRWRFSLLVQKDGEKRKWGTLTVGKGKALVLLKRVMVQSAKVPFSFVPSEGEELDGIVAWDKKDRTLVNLCVIWKIQL